MSLAAQNKLATDYIPLARKLVVGLCDVLRGKGDRDELESDAMLGLIQASRTFDAAVGVGFAEYARHAIWNRMLDGVRKKNKGKLKYGIETTSLDFKDKSVMSARSIMGNIEIDNSAHNYRLGIVDAMQAKRSRAAKTFTFPGYKVKVTRRTNRTKRKAA